MASASIRMVPPVRPATLSSLRPHRSRGAILAAARALYRDRPADAVSMEMIAMRAGLTRRTVYNQFVDAAELYRATREELIFEVVGLLPLGVAAELPPRAALRSYCSLVAQAFADPRYIELVGSIVRDSWSAPWLGDAYQRHIRLPVLHSFQGYLQALRPGAAHEIDGRRAANNLFATIEAMAMAARLIPGAEAELPDCTPDLIDAFMARLCPPAVRAAMHA